MISTCFLLDEESLQERFPKTRREFLCGLNPKAKTGCPFWNFKPDCNTWSTLPEVLCQEQIAWTAAGSTNGWLALDRNGNGLIDSGQELFGNVTAQPSSPNPNGFLALAVFDTPAQGGNGDGIINNQDAIWPKLLVWIDSNHDGISQPGELHRLDQIGVQSISLAYTNSPYTDAYGNKFRYKGSLIPDSDSKVDRIVYDVILQTVQ